MRDGSPKVMEKGVGVVDQVVVVYRSVIRVGDLFCTDQDNLMLSIVIRVCFVYRFCLIWNLSSSRV